LGRLEIDPVTEQVAAEPRLGAARLAGLASLAERDHHRSWNDEPIESGLLTGEVRHEG
jgi:hypothetical protein